MAVTWVFFSGLIILSSENQSHIGLWLYGYMALAKTTALSHQLVHKPVWLFSIFCLKKSSFLLASSFILQTLTADDCPTKETLTAQTETHMDQTHEGEEPMATDNAVAENKHEVSTNPLDLSDPTTAVDIDTDSVVSINIETKVEEDCVSRISSLQGRYLRQVVYLYFIYECFSWKLKTFSALFMLLHRHKLW